MAEIVFVLCAVLGCVVSGKLAARSMERRNSPAQAVLIGIVIPPLFVVAGAFLAAQFISNRDLQTGGLFALGLMTIFAAGLSAAVGGMISGAIASTNYVPTDDGER